MNYCFNCGRPLKDGEKCDCIDIKMSDDMVKNIQNNSYDLYDKDRYSDLMRNRLIENENVLEHTIELLSQLEDTLAKLEQAKEAMDKLNGNVKTGVLSKDTVWKTNERYYEILDNIRTKIDSIDK